MRIIRGVLIGLLTVLATGAGVLYYTEINAEQELENTVKTTNIMEIEKKIHDQVNAERTKHGLSPVRFDMKLTEIARAYSQQMARENFFSHYDPQGNDFTDRYNAAAFNCAIRQGENVHTGSENLFLIHVGKWISPFGSVLEYYTTDEIAHEVVKGWMNSPSHRDNILTAFWQSEGIGLTIAKDGKIYVTENFC